jgi:hypothetical protein
VSWLAALGFSWNPRNCKDMNSEDMVLRYQGKLTPELIKLGVKPQSKRLHQL